MKKSIVVLTASCFLLCMTSCVNSSGGNISSEPASISSQSEPSSEGQSSNVSVSSVLSVPSDQVSSAQPSSAADSSIQPSSKPVNYDSSDGRPPLEAKLKKLYDNAKQAFFPFAFGSFDYDSSKPGIEDYWYELKAPYDTMKSAKTYLMQYFTKDMAETLLENAPFKEYNGKLYVTDTGRGGNIYYAGHVFELVSRTDDKIVLNAKVYDLKEEPCEDDPFYTVPSNPENYETRNVKFVLKMTDDGWRFSEFKMLY